MRDATDQSSRKVAFEKHIGETILSIALIVLTIVMGIRKDIDFQTTWVITILTGTIGLSVALLKDYLLTVAERLSKRDRLIEAKSGHIGAILEALTGKNFEHANSIVDDALQKLQKIPHGIIPLDENTYFVELLSAMRNASGNCKIFAVNTINMARWAEDPRQKTYFRANIEAVRRGIEVHRIFVVDKSEMTSSKREVICSAINEQRTNGIKVGLVWAEDIRANKDLHDDFVLFDLTQPALFLDEFDPHDTTRVLRGELITDQDKITKYRRNLDMLSSYSLDEKDISGVLATAQ